MFKLGRSNTGIDYLWEKEYDTRGVLLTETVYDEFDNVIVRLEGTFQIIPFGNYYIGFTIMGIVAIIIISIRRKHFRIKNA